MTPRKTKSLLTRFCEKLRPGQKCPLEWAGSFRWDNYGQLGVVQNDMTWTQKGAHVVAFFLENGIWPEPGLVVRHRCDNRVCVTPEHLLLGYPADNSLDMVQRCGSRVYEGVTNSEAKLSGADVRAIRTLRRDWHIQDAALATVFQVGKSTIGRVRRRQVYKYV